MDRSPINASCHSILKSVLHCLVRTNVAPIAWLIGLRFLASWASEPGADFSSALIVYRLFVG